MTISTVVKIKENAMFAHRVVEASSLEKGGFDRLRKTTSVAKRMLLHPCRQMFPLR